MKDAENKDYSRDLVLRVSPSRNAFVVEEHKPGGIISYREIDPLELYYAISGSYTSNDFLESGFLPDHCLHVSMSTTERNYIIWNPGASGRHHLPGHRISGFSHPTAGIWPADSGKRKSG